MAELYSENMPPKYMLYSFSYLLGLRVNRQTNQKEVKGIYTFNRRDQSSQTISWLKYKDIREK